MRDEDGDVDERNAAVQAGLNVSDSRGTLHSDWSGETSRPLLF